MEMNKYKDSKKKRKRTKTRKGKVKEGGEVNESEDGEK